METWQLPYIQQLRTELQDLHNPLTTVLLNCDEPFFDELRSFAENLADQRSLHHPSQSLAVLRDAAHKKMTSSEGLTLAAWMRFYTDASILMCLAEVNSSNALRSIADLDRIIIFCGPASRRLDFILAIILNIQIAFFPCPGFSSKFNTQPQATHAGNNILINSHHSIPSLLESPSLLTFQSSWSDRPFILRDHARDWPAFREHPWHSAAYLRSVSGPGRIVPVEVGKDYRVQDWTQRLMSWDTFLARLELNDQPPPVESSDVVYLAQHNLFLQFPALRDDIIVPDYAYASVYPSDFSGYHPPGNDEKLVINAWLGSKDTISPAHTDPYFNMFVQVVGRKTVWLAPPSWTPCMYPFSSTIDGNYPALNSSDCNMSNTSRVDVFSKVDRQEFPDFLEQVVPNAINATLQPGDLLYLPPGWWHAMRSEDTSFSISMWF